MIVKNGNYILEITQTKDNRVLKRYSDKEEELKPDYPELLDVLFTDYCDYGCDFCYLGCSRVGKSATLDSIEKTLLSVPNWTEINCAGGNIIKHPEFREITKRLNRFQSLNTTINPQALFEVEPKAFEGFNAVGISTYSETHFMMFKTKILDLSNYSNINIQVIPEMITAEQTCRIIERMKGMKAGMLLLGFKQVGRGKDKKFDLTDLEVKAILEAAIENNIQLSVDTSFVSKYCSIISQYADKMWWDIKEGQFSYYIDCVNNYCCKSSWTQDKKFPITNDFDCKKMFKKIKEVENNE